MSEGLKSTAQRGTDAGEDAEKQEPYTLIGGDGGCKLMQPMWKTMCKFVKK